MVSITIRGLDESLKSKLRIRAAEHGRSMEAEAREILKCGLARDPTKPSSAESIRKRVKSFWGVIFKSLHVNLFGTHLTLAGDLARYEHCL